MIRRIHIIGSSGSGKSYTAQVLSNQLGIPAFDLDDLFWDNTSQKYGVRTDPQKRNESLQKLVRQNCWIIEGVYYDWLEPSFRVADLILALQPSVCLRDWRITIRFIKRRLGISLGKYETFADFIGLIKWNHQYDQVNFPNAKSYIQDLGQKWIVCSNLTEVLKIIETKFLVQKALTTTHN